MYRICTKQAKRRRYSIIRSKTATYRVFAQNLKRGDRVYMNSVDACQAPEKGGPLKKQGAGYIWLWLLIICQHAEERARACVPRQQLHPWSNCEVQLLLSYTIYMYVWGGGGAGVYLWSQWWGESVWSNGVALWRRATGSPL